MPDEFIVSRTSQWDKITDKVTMDHAVTDIIYEGKGKDRAAAERRARRDEPILLLYRAGEHAM